MMLLSLRKRVQNVQSRLELAGESVPVQQPFQILGIDMMDLPLTESGNRHVVVVQDLFTFCISSPRIESY